jgi:transposase
VPECVQCANISDVIGSDDCGGATDELVMLFFIQEILSTVVEKDDIVVLDNLTSHKTRRVRDVFAALGVEVWYLPPYSPDLNPIELCPSKFKALLKQAARTYRILSKAIGEALKNITAADIENWARHCGYGCIYLKFALIPH